MQSHTASVFAKSYDITLLYSIAHWWADDHGMISD